MSATRITRLEGARGILGSSWYPARDEAGRILLGKGRRSDEAKEKESTVVVATEEEAIALLQTWGYWIQMTYDGYKDDNLIQPSTILIDGQPIARAGSPA